METTKQPAGDYGTYIVINPRPEKLAPSAIDIFVGVLFLITVAWWILQWRKNKDK